MISLTKLMSEKVTKMKNTIMQAARMNIVAEIVYMYPVVPLQLTLVYHECKKKATAIAVRRQSQ